MRACLCVCVCSGSQQNVVCTMVRVNKWQYINRSFTLLHKYIYIYIFPLLLPFILVFLLSFLPSSFASFNFPFYESGSKLITLHNQQFFPRNISLYCIYIEGYVLKGCQCFYLCIRVAYKNAGFLTLKMRQTGCSETSVNDYHYSLRNSSSQCCKYRRLQSETARRLSDQLTTPWKRLAVIYMPAPASKDRGKPRKP